MTSRIPPADAHPRPAPDFDPVPLRYRRDGCTPERQAGLMRALAECGCLREACRRIGLSLESAYRLYRRPDAASFRRAWDAAMAAARPARPVPPPPAQPVPPCRPLRAVTPAAAVPAQAGCMPAYATQPRTSWQASTSSTFSTSAPVAAETDRTCRIRRVHQLPPGHRLPAMKAAGVDSPAALCFRRRR